MTTKVWPEEVAALQLKVDKVATPKGVKKYDAPIGTPIVAGRAVQAAKKAPQKAPIGKPKTPGSAAPKAPDARHTQGQTPGNFRHPQTGHAMGKTEIGDTYEQLFKAKMEKEMNAAYGCCMRLITGAGAGSSRTTPLDFQVGNKGGEVKTLSSLSKNQKTAIKKEEVARKVAAIKENNWEALLIVQVVDQQSGQVHVYAHPAFESKAVKVMVLIGTYDYGPADFQKAQTASGHWDKAATRAAQQAAKQGAAAGTKSAAPPAPEPRRPGSSALPAQLGQIGMPYDPPDEDGGIIEPGDTIIELHEEDDGSLVPYIFTHPDTPADLEVKLFGRGPKKVETHKGEIRYEAPIGTPIVPHAHLKKPRNWKRHDGGYEKVDGKSEKYGKSVLTHDSGTITVEGGNNQGWRYKGTVGSKAVTGNGFKTIDDAKEAAEADLDKLAPPKPDAPSRPHTTEPPDPHRAANVAQHAPAHTGGHHPGSPPTDNQEITRAMWGGQGGMAGMDVRGHDGKVIPPRPSPGKWGALVADRGNGKGFFGKVTVEEYAQGLKEGAFDSYSPSYKASWLDRDGILHAVASHDQIPGGLDLMSATGAMRTIITTMTPGKTALTPPIKLVLAFEEAPNATQTKGVRDLMELLDIQHATIAFNVGVVDFGTMTRERQAEIQTGRKKMKRGEYNLEGRDVILRYLSDPTQDPTAVAASRSVDRRFLEGGLGGAGVADPNAFPGTQAFTGRKADDDELERADARIADMEVLAYMLDATRNEDWLKTRCWDIWLGSTLVSTLPQFQQYLRVQGLTLDHFLDLPAAEAMPESLREEVDLFRQDQMAGAMDVSPDPGTKSAVLDRMEEVLEKKATVKKVKTPAGVHRFHEPIGTPIVPRPRIPHAPAVPSLPDQPSRPPGLFEEREALLLTNPRYAADFEKNLKFVNGRLPETYEPFDPKTNNPLYADYVSTLNRRLAHAMVEPGPFGVVWYQNMDKIDKKTGQPGKWEWKTSPEGQFHLENIVNDELDLADSRGVPRDRHIIAAAGVSGSGKTSVLQDAADEFGIIYDVDPDTGKLGDPQNYLVSNPDDLKDRMKPYLPPEYAALGINPDETAVLTHELSSMANKAMIVAATKGDEEGGRPGGYNILLDATYEGALDKRLAEYEAFTKAGYLVSGILVDGDISTSLNRATGRHTAISSLLRLRLQEDYPDATPEEIKGKLRVLLRELDLSKPGVLDAFGIPTEGYAGRYVPTVLIGEQVAHGPNPIGPDGQEMLNAPWDGLPWKSRNAMNFYEAIAAGWFGGRWRIVDSHQVPIQDGDEFNTLRDLVNSPSTTGTKAAIISSPDGESSAMSDDTSAISVPRSVQILRDLYLDDNPPGTFRFLEQIVDYRLNLISFDELADWVRAWRNAPLLGLVDLGFHGSEDAFPQPGTHHELSAARMAQAVTRDEYRVLDNVFGERSMVADTDTP